MNRLTPQLVEEIRFPLVHPPHIIRDAAMDDMLQRRFYERTYCERALAKTKRCLKKLLPAG